MAKQPVRFTVRLPKGVYDAAVKSSTLSRRSLNSEIVYLLCVALEIPTDTNGHKEPKK